MCARWVSGVTRFLAVWLLLPAAAGRANERLFTYAYESPVLPFGAMENELWTTARVMRDHYFLRFDQRVELEWGLGRGVQTAFYVNTRGQAQTSPDGLQKAYEFRGVSSEWKWQMSDPSTNFIGSALYAEVTWMPHEIELEGKVILDRWFGPVLLAYNLVAEAEIEAEQGKGKELEWERVYKIENVLGVTYNAAGRFHVGLEVWNVNVFQEGKLGYSALLLGPCLAISGERFWAAWTFLAQAPAFQNSKTSPHSSLVLDDLERYQTRLLLGVHW